MEPLPNVALLQELQAVHDTGMLLRQRGTCYDIGKRYKENPQTPEEVRKTTKTKNQTEVAPYILQSIIKTEQSTYTRDDSNQNLNPTATKATIRVPSVPKRTVNVNNSIRDEEKHLNISERLKCQLNHCNKTFAKKRYLRRHMFTHTNARIFKCNFERCDNKFNRSDALLRHRRAHAQTALFECPECHKNLSRPDSLARHINTKHKSNIK